jgi:C-terminal processing protease CtpA/Prc
MITELCDNIKTILHEKLFHPRLQGEELEGAINRFSSLCVVPPSHEGDEVSRVNRALSTLGVSNVSFWKLPSRPVESQWAINATLSLFLDGQNERWVFDDVLPGGLADRAGIKPGECLIALDGKDTVREPRFQLGKTYQFTILGRDGRGERQTALTLAEVGPKNRPPMIPAPPIAVSEPRSGVGVVRISSFPGIIGFDFARELMGIARQFERQGHNRMIVDLRANCGGGLGSLRVMSLFTPAKLPVGYSLSRAARESKTRPDQLPAIERIPHTKLGLYMMAGRFTINRGRSIRLFTEGLGKLPFQGNISVLTNRFTRSGAEMVAAFGQKNGLAKIVGTATPGETLGAANFVINDSYRLRIPLVGWYTSDDELLEGKGVSPDQVVNPTLGGLREGRDEVLEAALQS